MEWLILNPQLHSMFASLGTLVGDSFTPNPDCHSTLDEILKRLSIEDRTLRTFRRAIGFSQVIKKDLLPLLINIKDDRKITDTTIKILVNLTMPVECLLPIEVMSKTDAGRNTIYELNWLLNSCKEAFLDPKSTRKILDHIRILLDLGDKMKPDDCESLNNCIILLRNILHIPELRPTNQNQILWNLFAQNIDKILIELMTGKYKSKWGVAIVQLIALLYKDQHVATLQKLLNLWFEASLSESSEDNESNTSPPVSHSNSTNERGFGDSSSSMMTSDPTSDSSDNSDQTGGEFKPKELPKPLSKKPKPQIRKQPKQANRIEHKQVSSGSSSTSGNGTSNSTLNKNEESSVKMECGSSEISDCGYGTQVENQEPISSSSNEEDTPNRGKPIYQKPAKLLQKSRYQGTKVPPTPQEKEEMRRKKLVKRSRKNSMNMKALIHHTPNDEDISHLLKEFTVDFLLKGYGSLVTELRSQMSSAQAALDTSHFFWLVTYFLKFATQLELDLEHICPVLSFDIVSYLTFEGVNLSEQFELAKAQSASDLTPCLRRMHLVVTAIRELVQAVETYKKINHLSKEDQQNLSTLQRQMCETEELRCLFVLLLRQFTPTLQSKQYLQDVIVTNHMLLSFIEACSLPDFATTLHNHMKQFVAVDVMRQYGLLLECFEENGQFVNDCIFTMMHHVAGDLEHVSALFQPSILKTFSLIWESEFQICDDWSDLIEYVIHKFINIPRTIPLVQENSSPDEGDPVHPPLPPPPPQTQIWSQEECDSLYWYYVQSANSRDPVGSVINLYAESGITNKTRIGIIEQLLEQDVITRMQYNELMEKEPISNVTRKKSPQQQMDKENLDEIELLKEHLVKEDKLVFVTWVQKVLLEACHAKLSLNKKPTHIVEPVAYYCTLLEEPIPVVAWNCEQCSMMQYQPFMLLLHKLGLHLPADAGKVFARIPHFWTPDILYRMATKLGPLQPSWVKFDPVEVEDWTGVGPQGPPKMEEPLKETKTTNLHPFTGATHHAPAYITYTPEPTGSSNWLEMAQKSKATTAHIFKESDVM